MGSCPIFHRKNTEQYDCHAKRRMKKKDLEKKNTRLILIPLLHTKIVLLLIDIMQLFFFFSQDFCQSQHTHPLFGFFLSYLNWFATHSNPASHDIRKKTIMTKTMRKQTNNRPNCLSLQTLFSFSLSHPLILQPKHCSLSRHLYLFCCCGITCGCWILDVLGRGFIEGGMGIWGGRG